MKVLLVDDNMSRVQSITDIVVNEFNDQLYEAHSYEDAIEKINCNRYDLVIVDAFIPKSYGDFDDLNNYGLDFIKNVFEKEDDFYRPLGCIMVSDFVEDSNVMNTMISYPVSIIDTKSRNNWKIELEKNINYFHHLIKKSIDIGIVTATDTEFNIVDKIFNGISDIQTDFADFKLATIDSKGKKISVIYVQAENKGMVSSAMATSQLLEYYSPRQMFMLGVAAGNPSETNFSDIVIANNAFDYSSGAIVESEDGKLVFENEPLIEKSSDELIKIFRKYCNNSQIKTFIKEKADVNDDYDYIPNIYCKDIVSGPLVVKSKTFTELYIKNRNRKYYALDMEIYAFYHFCHRAIDAPRFLAIKSISDHGDKFKSKAHQKYGVRLVVELLKYYIENNYNV